MKYNINKPPADFLRFSKFIEVKKDDFKQIVDAKKNLLQILFIEEKLYLVTENYNEYETELLSIASRTMLFHNDNYFSISNDRNIIGRRLVNLMTVCRMFLDSINHHLNKICSKDLNKINLVEDEKSNQVDNRIGYRCIQAFRNYVQHRGFPIHIMIVSYKKVQTGDESKQSHVAIPLLKTSILEEDGKFIRSVLKEIKLLENKNGIDIRPLVRDYIEGIWKNHETTRKLISTDLMIWEKN